MSPNCVNLGVSLQHEVDVRLSLPEADRHALEAPISLLESVGNFVGMRKAGAAPVVIDL